MLLTQSYLKRINLDLLKRKRLLKAATRYHVYAYLKIHKPSTLPYQESHQLDAKVFELNHGNEKLRHHDLERELHWQIKSLPSTNLSSRAQR